MRNPYELLKLAQETKDTFNELLNNSTEYDKVIAVIDKHFNQVARNYNFEGMVFQMGYEKGQAMLDELNKLKEETK